MEIVDINKSIIFEIKRKGCNSLYVHLEKGMRLIYCIFNKIYYIIYLKLFVDFKSRNKQLFAFIYYFLFIGVSVYINFSNYLRLP